jgi:hypothetical protein
MANSEGSFSRTALVVSGVKTSAAVDTGSIWTARVAAARQREPDAHLPSLLVGLELEHGRGGVLPVLSFCLTR